MPSMVVTLCPSASTPSIRQEQTIVPSTMTVQAPQSPEPQPSLVPVRFNSSRSTSSIVCCASQRNSTGSPLMTVVTWCLLIPATLPLISGARHRAFEGDGRGPPCQNAGDLGAIFDRAALVVDLLARR